MNDEDKTKKQLINELIETRMRIAELEGLLPRKIPTQPDEFPTFAEKRDGTKSSLPENDSAADISGYKRTLKEVLESPLKWQITFNSVSDAICLLDMEDRVLDCNEAMLNLLGKPIDEVIGNTCWKLVHGTSEPIESCPVVRMRKSRIRECMELPVGDRWFDVSADPIENETGDLVGAVHILSDITERKLSEGKLKDSEQLLQCIIQGYPIPAFMIGKDHRVIHWNRALEEVSGIGAPAVIGTSQQWRAFYREERPCMADLLVDEDLEAIARWYAERASKSEILDEAYEATQFFPDLGEMGKWLHFTAAAVRNSRGILIGAIETLEDITDRKKAEEVLRESENRYRAIFGNTGTATVILEEDTIISIANAEFEKLTGYTREEIENKKSWMEFVVKEDLERMLGQHRLRRADSDAALKQYEFRLIDRHGQTKDILLTIDVIAGTKRSVASLLDITERKRAEEELQKTNQTLQAIIDASPLAIFTLDHDLRVTNWSPTAERIFGWTSREAIGQYNPIVPAEKWDEFKVLVSKVLSGIAYSGSEVWRQTKDGRSIFVNVSTAPLRDAHGNVVGAMGVIQDITSRKRAEEALQETEERFKLLVENATYGIFVQTQFRFAYLNPEAVRLFGAESADQLLGQPVLDRFDPRFHDIVRERIRLLNEEKIAVPPVEQTYCRMDGSSFIVEVSAVPTRWRDHDGAFVSFQDITERRRKEDEIRRVTTFLDSIIENIPDMIFVKDAKDLRFVRFNRAGEELLGLSRDNLLGKNDYDFFPKEQADFFTEKDRDVLRGNEIVDIPEEPIQTRNKGERILHTKKVPIIDAKGEPDYLLGISEDITNHKRAKEELRETNEYLNNLFNYANAPIIVWDPEFHITRFNHAFEKLTGRKAGDVIGNKLEILFPPALVDSSMRLIVKTLLGERWETVEISILHVDGVVRTVLWNSATIFAADGTTPVATIAQGHDITERKKAEEALKESQQQLADIINFLPDATLVIDKGGKVIAWNRAIEEMTGIKAEDILGKSDYEYALPFYDERRPILIDLVLKPHKELDSKYVRLQRKDGVLVGEALAPAVKGTGAYLFATATALHDSLGNIVGAIESIRDISERRQMENMLASERERLISILDGIPIPTFMIDGNRQVVLWNRYNEAYTGMPKDSILGRPVDLSFLFQEKVSPSLAELILEKGDDDLTARFGERGLRKSEVIPNAFESVGRIWITGEERTLSIQAARVVDSKGIVVGAVQTAQDITENKNLEARLLQMQKMEAIGTLAGGIAHDFNNVLAAVIGYTEMTKARIDQPDLHRYLEQVLRACERARDLVSQILTFSRVREQEKKPIDIASLVKESLKMLRATIPSTITFRSKIHPGVYTVLADPTQIHQVLMNLCTNAAHAMRERGGELGVCLDNVEITPQNKPLHVDLDPRPYVKVTVSDTGTGIAPGIINKIFDPFFTTKETGKGTGLGLSVVYGIVRECGGTVTVHSEPRAGSVFSVYLPAITNIAEVPQDIVEPIPGGTERILFVDDEEILVEMWRDILENLGYTVTATTGSTKALEIFLSRPDQFDLVITDMTMPGMTGIGLSKEILGLRPAIPIILCTGFSELITEEKVKALGIKGFAMKPLRLRIIAHLIRKALEQRRV
jgi:PAS domain S-box-containing protein